MGCGTQIILMAIILAIFFLTPLPRYFVSLVPSGIKDFMFYSVYRNITLSDKTTHYDVPFTLENKGPLPILGRNTGLCFTFESHAIDGEILDQARRNTAIADIIAIDRKSAQYKLEAVTVSSENKDTVICQKFSLDYSVLPEDIKALQIRPEKSFTASKIVWSTAIDVR